MVKLTKNNLKFESLESRCLLSGSYLIPVDGLVAYYPFNGSANDESGNENNGIVRGATPTSDRFENVDSALDFHGNFTRNDYVRARDSPSLNIRNSLTISAWINRDFSSKYIVVKGQHNVTDNYSLYLDEGFPTFGINTTNRRRYTVGSTERATSSIWMHIAGVYDRGSLSIYVNGEMKNSRVISGTLLQLYNNSISLYIGADGAYHGGFRGKIDDVAIYNRALNENEIQQLFNNKPIQDINKPIIIIPGILGSMPEGHSTSLPVFYLRDLRRFIRRVSLENESVIIRPYNPNELTSERVRRTYNRILESFIDRGYSFCDLDNPNIKDDSVNCDNADLFFASYDWRLPVFVNQNNPEEILWDDDTSTFQSSVEYLDWWINLAKEKWLNKGGSESDFSASIIAHSMGGLIARAYIEEADEAGHNAEKIDHLIMLGTPNRGSVAIYQFFDPVNHRYISGNLNYTDSIFNHYLTLALKNAVRSIENRYGLDRSSLKSEDLVPSLRDLLPNFPFVKIDDIQQLQTRNNLLLRLNRTIDDLTNAVDVLLIGGNDIQTPIRANITGRILEFETVREGDGVVLYEHVDGFIRSGGLALQNIESIEFSRVRHGNLPGNQEIISRIFDEIFTGD